VSATNLELVTYAMLKINIFDENSAPSPEQGVTALNVLNDMMADMSKDGIKLGWYPQTSLAATSPLQNEDIGPVKLLLCSMLAAHYGITLGELLLAEVGKAYTRLAKTALKYSEADLSELPRTQGLFNGGWY
jgi:hypothetical protein